ncbi:MAG: type II toxin-antitoxin system RelE/ParE family toxin [Caulobacteraceae bacterium]|nr:type II toxin-antitoxin system RelE/ParE family toxin [Caulobacteraceae bacterium]
MAYRLSRRADEDVVAIYVEGVREFGADQAETYYAGLVETFLFLAEFPKAARERTETRPPVRIHPYRSHIVVYVIEGDDIWILRVRHGREDWSNDLREGGAA